MNLLDLYEGREPHQQAIDKLEQRRIADLEARMDDCARRGDVAGFRKAKEERDSYHTIKTNEAELDEKLKGLPSKKLGSARDLGKSVKKFRAQRGLDEGEMKRAMEKDAERMSREAFCKKYGNEDWVCEFWDNVNGPMDESGIGHDIADKKEKIARATPQSKAGAVASTVKNAAKWLAGKGGPGKEGPTYEAAQKKNSEKVNEYISVASDKNFKEAEPYKNYKIYVRKQPFGNTGLYTAHTEIDRKGFMEKGTSPEEAVQAIRDKIDFVLNAQKKVTGSSTIDFNVKFATDLLADPKQTFYAKLENVNGEPKLVIAGDTVANDPELLAAGDFKRSAVRNQVDDQGRATPLPGIPLTAKSLRAGEWIANGRYTIGKETQDRDGNRVFDLTYHSTAHTKSDKLRLNQPAFTLGTTRDVDEDKARDLTAAVMLKKAHAAFPSAKDATEALALWIADKEQRDVNRLEKENEQEEEMIARIIDQLKSKEVDEGWSDAIVARRTGRPRTPYSIYIKGRKWKDFENEDHAENVANKLRAKFKAEGKDPSVITIAPTDYDKGMDEAANPAQQAAIAIAKKKEQGVTEDTGSWIVYDPETKQIKKRFKTHTAGKSYAQTHKLGFASSEYYFDNIKTAVTAEGMTDFQKRRQRERDIDAGRPVARQRPSKQTDYQKRRAQDRKDMELGEEKTRLDPKCWKGKKIGTPKTKMKGGVRVNNCVPAESVEEEAKKGLYYYVNKRKKAGTSRDKDDPRAPSAQDWKNAAKTAKKESVEEEWSEKYKRSIDCSHPKGFSQKAHCAGRKKNEGMFSTLGEDNEARDAVESAIIRRILVAHKDLLQKFGPQKVMDAASAIADDHADVEEIGTSDVSAYVHEVERYLAMNH